MVEIQTRTLDHFFDYCPNIKEEETKLNVDVVAAIPTTQTEADAPSATTNEVEIVDENPTFYESPEAEVVDETVRVGVEARDEDLFITYATDAGDKEDVDEEDDDEDDDSPKLPDARMDLGDDDDEDDDDDDFTI
ncbi:histone H2A.Z-specific chaperone CHZ1-like [Cynara cardunculus var. scolymus]|uniref:histone H2A.Z-specific chaperone CHZ1-like n=1 Tax=Cynara cardunculus var. scolymus TaxID=59895 RepID=UPI000D62A0C2|nr:histone H2A.Z-specific chaperone CHZ1-like [Cynara cardunculus var. scolymus]